MIKVRYDSQLGDLEVRTKEGFQHLASTEISVTTLWLLVSRRSLLPPLHNYRVNNTNYSFKESGTNIANLLNLLSTVRTSMHTSDDQLPCMSYPAKFKGGINLFYVYTKWNIQ